MSVAFCSPFQNSNAFTIRHAAEDEEDEEDDHDPEQEELVHCGTHITRSCIFNRDSSCGSIELVKRMG